MFDLRMLSISYELDKDKPYHNNIPRKIVICIFFFWQGYKYKNYLVQKGLRRTALLILIPLYSNF